MFVYLLIASELAVLYLVFWYLYVREPKCKRRISADLWGMYDRSMNPGQADPTLPFVQALDRQRYYADAYHEKAPEYVLDHITNRYVPVAEANGLMQRMAATVDSKLSQLNVKP